MRIGIDIGGTRIKIAGLEDERVIFKKELSFSLKEEPDRVVSRIKQAVRDISISSIGIGIAGLVEYKKGLLISSPNLPLWKGINIPLLFRDFFNTNIAVDNDANVYAWGEYRIFYRDLDNFLLITMGTGIGSGIILKGEVYHGSRMLAGEIGHITIIPDGRYCLCGNKGCLEVYIGSKGILDMAWNRGLQVEEVYDIYALAKKGNRKAKEVFEKVGVYLAIGLTNVIQLLDPDTIVLGGGVSNAFELFYPSLEQELKQRIYEWNVRSVYIRPSQLGSFGGAIGAAFLPEP